MYSVFLQRSKYQQLLDKKHGDEHLIGVIHGFEIVERILLEADAAQDQQLNAAASTNSGIMASPKPPRPTVVCLCGSTRFYKAFRKANLNLTLTGKIVLSIGCDFKSDDGLGLTVADKIRLDELHKRKIDLADEILVLNVGGYIGDSTRNEIEYAKRLSKHICYLE